MRLGRSSRLLGDLWDSSISMTDRDLKDFDGIYRVEMATGVIPQLPNWRKYISNTRDMLPVDDSQVSGYNVIFKNGVGFPGRTFGNFGVRLYHYSPPQREGLYTGLVLVYNNGLFRDYLRKIALDLFLGKFYLAFGGRAIFMGYFWLYATEPYRRDRGKVYKDDYFRADLDTDDQGYGFGNDDTNIMYDADEAWRIPLTEIGTIAEIGEGEQIGDVLEDIPDEIVRKPEKAIEPKLVSDTAIDEKEGIEADKAKGDDSLMDGWVEE